MNSIIDDSSLSETGRNDICWFREQMPLMKKLEEQFSKTKPFDGLTLGICMHVEPKTAVWIECLLAGGAGHVFLIGNLGTTKPATAAYLASNPKITVFARKDDSLEDHERYAQIVMEQKPQILIDNGANLILAYYSKERDWKPFGANEETRSGRLRIDDAGIKPTFPIIVIDDSPLKRLLENATGVGQSVVDGFMRATSLLLGGKRVLVIGYGYVGSGIANKFKAMGASTMVYDKDPVYLLKAKVDGHIVDLDLENLIRTADAIVTATGRFHIIRKEHAELFKDGVILCNAGHFSFEIDVDDLRDASDRSSLIERGKEVLEFGGKKVFILENANPVNLSAGTGNPIEIMDLGLGLQACCAARLAEKNNNLDCKVQAVPRDIDEFVSYKMLGA